MDVLIISPELPYPPISGEKIRCFNLIKRLSRKNYRVSVISLIAFSQERYFAHELSKYCQRVETVLRPWESDLRYCARGIWYFLTGQSLCSKYAFFEEMAQQISELTASNHFDIVQVEHSFMAPYIDSVCSDEAKKILTFHNIVSTQLRRTFEVEKSVRKKIRFLFDWMTMEKWEAKFAGKFDKCIAVSSVDKEILKAMDPALDVSVIPNGVDIEHYKPLPTSSEYGDILSVGLMSYHPNIDGMLYFCGEILPLVSHRVPDVHLVIVGDNPPRRVKQLASSENVTVTGFVDDVLPYYERCALSIVPLRSGGGTRLKILESMALCRPVVSTSVGCEGLEVTHGKDIMIADKPADFAECIVQLLTNTELRKEITRNGRKLVEACYSWDTIVRELIEVYEELISR